MRPQLGKCEEFLAAILAMPTLLTQIDFDHTGPSRVEILPSKKLANAVKAGFRLRNTSLYKWCAESGIRHQGASQILSGRWTGPTAKRHLQAMIEASGAAALMGSDEAGGGQK
jgi:hypothetical protein